MPNPSALQLFQGAVEAIPKPPDYAHPIVEQLAREITAGRMTAEEAYAQAHGFVQQANQPQPQPAPQQAGLGAMPAPQTQAPAAAAQVPAPAPQPAPVQPVPSMGPPPIAPEVRGGPTIPQVGTPPVNSLPAASLGAAPGQALPTNGAPDPLANQNNTRPSPGLPVQKAQNQFSDSLSNTQGQPVRTEGAKRDLVAEDNAGQQQAPQQTPQQQGAGFARAALTGGPRMTNKDVSMLMDVYTKGGKPAMDLMKEQGKAFRASENNRVKLRIAGANNDVRAQAIEDRWNQGVSRLSLDQQREADRVAQAVLQANAAKEKLDAAMLRFYQGGQDKALLQAVKFAHDDYLAQVRGAVTLGASMNAILSDTKDVINEMETTAGKKRREYEAMRNYSLVRSGESEAPAPQAYPGAVDPVPTAGEKLQETRGTKANVEQKAPQQTKSGAVKVIKKETK